MTVLIASLTIFPLLASAYGWGGIRQASLIITCVFVSVWLIVTLLAAITKSKALINTHVYYWLAMAVVCIFVSVAWRIEVYVFEMIASYLFIFLLTPIVGIFYLFPNITDILLLSIIPVFMSLLGLFIKMKIIKTLPEEKSGE